jgi:hypothetical protein
MTVEATLDVYEEYRSKRLFQPHRRGDGIAPLYIKDLDDGTMERIEMLGKLNDRRKKHLGTRSRAGLYRLAAEYKRMGMHMMAADVLREAREL